jgi:heat-inducible transcriptional repressor
VSDKLDPRKSAVLRTVVSEYIETAQPVGSSHVVRDTAIGVSPATVRADMAALERDGYLTHPHTSAGRIPTDKGYRFFVDSLAGPTALGRGQQQQIREFFANAHGEIERMLRDTSGLLATLTDYAAVVVGPTHEALTIRSTLLVRLSRSMALLVIVLSNGAVDKHTIDLDDDVDDADLAETGASLQAVLDGRPVTLAHLEVLGACLERDLGGRSGHRATATHKTDRRDPTSPRDRLVRACASALEQGARPASGTDQVYVGGAARMAEQFDAIGQVRAVLSILEESYVVVSLMNDVLAQGQSVAIGSENHVESLAQCSVVVAPYAGQDEVSGAIGLLGPTRMNYPQAMAAVALVARRLGRQLAAGQ